MTAIEHVPFFSTIMYRGSQCTVRDTQHKTDHVSVKGDATGYTEKVEFGTMVEVLKKAK